MIKMKNTIILLIISVLITIHLPVSSVASSDNPLLAAGFFHFKGEKTAPDFMLKDLEDNTIRLDAFQGKVVLLYFWTTW